MSEAGSDFWRNMGVWLLPYTAISHTIFFYSSTLVCSHSSRHLIAVCHKAHPACSNELEFLSLNVRIKKFLAPLICFADDDFQRWINRLKRPPKSISYYSAFKKSKVYDVEQSAIRKEQACLFKKSDKYLEEAELFKFWTTCPELWKLLTHFVLFSESRTWIIFVKTAICEYDIKTTRHGFP